MSRYCNRFTERPRRISMLRLSCGIAALLASACAASAQTSLPPVIVESASRAVRPHSVTPTSAPASGSTTTTTSSSVPGDQAEPVQTATEPPSPTSAYAPGDLLSNQGTSTTVVSGDDLRAQQARVPGEALRSLPGVLINRTGPYSGVTQMRIRGAEGRHTTVLIDGIEANNPGDGEFDFSNLVGSEEIESIEILRGPQSGLYGSGAIGGVVSIRTKSGKGPLTLTTRAETGSYSTKDAAAVLSAGGDKAWGLVGFQSRKTGGFNVAPLGNEKDGSTTASTFAKVGFSPLEGLVVEGLLRRTSKRGNRDEENFEIPGALIVQTDAPSRFSSDLWLGSLESKLSLFGGAWVQSVRADRRSIVNDDLSDNPSFALFGPSYERYRANAETYRYTSTLRLDTPALPQVRHFVTGLVESKREGFVQYTYDGIDHERGFRSTVGEVRGEYGNTLFLSGAWRQDNPDAFQDYATWRTSASLKIPETPLRLHASYGTGVKFPSLFEQFGRVPNFFQPNPGLRPETSTGWDAGAEVTLFQGRAVVDATWFEADLTDRIRRITLPSGLSTSENVAGLSQRHGLEVAGRFIVLPGLVVGTSYTWLTTEDPNGREEIRRPRHSGRIDASYTFDRERARIGVSAAYNGTMFDDALRTSQAPCFFGCFPLVTERVKLKDYTLLTLTASYQLTPALELYARGENLLDRRYEEVYGFQSAGATAFVGLRMRLQDVSVAEDKPRRP